MNDTDQPADSGLTAVGVIQKLLAERPTLRFRFRGCSDFEIHRLEHQTGLTLPEEYRAFLRQVGRGAGPLMQDSEYQYERLAAIQAEALALLEAKHGPALPQRAFVFALRPGEQFVFFEAADPDRCGAVLLFYAGKPEFRKVADSLGAYLNWEAGFVAL